jgi:hypothetical protein
MVANYEGVRDQGRMSIPTEIPSLPFCECTITLLRCIIVLAAASANGMVRPIRRHL